MQQLQNPRFPDSVADAIKAAGIEAQTLALELDESVLRDEAEQMRSTLRLLKRIGVRLAVHDFGTGDSSLRQLAALPIDTIKVERRFVAALGTEDATSPIAQAVIATGSALGLRVIGAGAESREQVEHLRRLGCTDVQGFLYAEPLPAARDQRDAGRGRRAQADREVAAMRWWLVGGLGRATLCVTRQRYSVSAASSICELQVAYISA